MTISLPNPALASPSADYTAPITGSPLPPSRSGNGFRRGRNICVAALAAAGLLVSASCSGGTDTAVTNGEAAADVESAASSDSGASGEAGEPGALAMSDDLFAPVEEVADGDPILAENISLLMEPGPDGGASTLRDLRQARIGGPAVSDGPADGDSDPVVGGTAQDAEIDQAEADNPALAGLAAGPETTDTSAVSGPEPTAVAIPTTAPTPTPAPAPDADDDTPDPTAEPTTDPTAGTDPAVGGDSDPVVGPAAGSLDFSNQSLIDTIYLGEDLDGADFSGSDLTFSVFAEISMTGADFTGAILMDAFFDQLDLTGANFTNADLSSVIAYDTILDNITYGNTTCPDGKNSDDLGGTCDGHFID